MDAREQFRIGNLLGQIVVDAGDVAALVVDARITHREHDDVGVLDAAAAQRLGECDAVHDGHLPVGDDQRIPLPIEQRQSLLAVARARDVETGRGQAVRHQLGFERIVVHDQDPRGSARVSTDIRVAIASAFIRCPPVYAIEPPRKSGRQCAGRYPMRVSAGPAQQGQTFPDCALCPEPPALSLRSCTEEVE